MPLADKFAELGHGGVSVKILNKLRTLITSEKSKQVIHQKGTATSADTSVESESSASILPN